MILDGKKIAGEIEQNIKTAIEKLKERRPALVFILVGDDPASAVYIRMKKKKCKEVGIVSVDYELPENVKEEKLLSIIAKLNEDPGVDGILVQLPLPGHIRADIVLEAIDPQKDIDGFHPLNMGRLLLGEKKGFFPCTPYGITILLQRANIATQGKHVVIVGRSNIVGKPLAALLMQKRKEANATVTVAHSATQNLKEICCSADILIAAMGSPRFIQSDMVKDNAVVIDVGISRENGKLIGDVNFEQVSLKCSAITPVPGGVGPMTVAMLLSNTLLAYQRSSEK